MKVKDIIEGRSRWMPSKDYDTEKPIVSVLLPTWKRAKSGLFYDAVQSVLKQSLTELELIIVDDCSTDGTFEIVQRIMQEDSRVCCIRHTENIGLPAISEFEAYQKARGIFIAFMFDDNEWELDALKQLVDYAKSNHVKAVAGQYQLFAGCPGDSYSNPSNWKIIGGTNVNLCDLMITNCFGNGSVLLHRDVIEKVGFLDPNIALSRLWDWDLWQRIAKEFRFEMTDILVGREKGTGLADSLGNTHQLFQWAAQERMHQPRNRALLPSNYLDCDIFEFSVPSSSFLYRSNCWVAKQYENKTWFSKQDPSLISITEKSQFPWNGKRIAYLTASIQVNASATLNWGRLPYSKEYVFFYSSLQYFDYNNWALADAIVIERDLSPNADVVIEWAKHMGIACYYYSDDNFKALANDYADTPLRNNMRHLAAGMTKEHLSKFDGVFCSTETLCTYFEKEMHQTCTLLTPILDSDLLQPYHAPRETINILFMGSFIRGKLLKDNILPPLLKLSKNYKVKFYCPTESLAEMLADDTKTGRKETKRSSVANWTTSNAPINVTMNDTLMLVGYPRTLSLELLLQRLAPEEIQIQLHCGPLIENNRYKTANALLNAVCLGAVLIATNDLPYSALPSDPPVCLLAENCPEAWESALRQAMDQETHRALYENALAYCQKTYSAEKGKLCVTEALKEVASCDLLDLNRRLLLYAQKLPIPVQQNSVSAAAPAPVSALPLQKVHLSSSIFLASLPGRRLSQTLQAMLPEWTPRGLGIARLLPLSLSRPLVNAQYVESRLPVDRGNIRVVVVPSSPMNVLFEFVSNNCIIGQNQVFVDQASCVLLEIPQKESGDVFLRIANCGTDGLLYVLQRNLFIKSVIDVISAEGDSSHG